MAVWGLLLSSWELQDQADLRGSNGKNSCFCVCRRWGELMFLISTDFISHSLSWLKFFVRKPIMQHICLSRISIFVLLSFFGNLIFLYSTFVNFPWSHNLHPWQEKLFGGYPSVDVLKRKINKLLGVAVSDEQEIKDAPRNPPWVQCCLKSYYIDRNDIWGSRQYRIFDTKISG